MAESTNTLLQSSIKIRHGRKWKSRCCVLVKLSPVSDQVILKFYKSDKELQTGKEIRRERFVVSAQTFCGIETCYRHPKNPFVLTVVCTDRIVLLSFSCHADLLDWYHKIRNQLTSVSEYKCRVAIPNRGKLPAGPAMMYIYENHFAITSQIPSLLYGGWSLADVTRYGVIEDGFAFDVVSTKDGGTFVVLCSPEQAETLKTHVDAATHCITNRWSHVSDTVSIHEETLPNRRHFSQEWQNLQTRDCDDDQNGPSNGSIPSVPGSPRAKYSPDTYSSKVTNTAMIEFYKQQASSTDTDDESVKERLLAEMCLNLSGGSNSPNGNNNTSPGGQTDVDGNVVDIIELYRTLTSATRGGGSTENSNGSEETTFTNAAAANYVRTPTKKTPIREQNYEIMASFDRFRNPMPVSHQRVQNVTNNTVTGTGNSPQKSKVDDNDYVNLPSPKKKPAGAVTRLNTAAAAAAAVQNAANDKVTIIEKRPSAGNGTLGATAAFVESDYVDTSGDNVRAPPLVKAATASSYRNLHHLEFVRTSSNASSVSDAVPSLPTTPTGKTFPAPFENLTELDSVVVKPKRKSKSKKNAPVPFNHSDLIKPVGPIAMLSVETNASGCSRSASESGDDIGHLGSSELLDECSEKSSSLRSRGRSLSRSRSRSESCDNGYSRDAIRPEDLPSPLPPDPLRTQLSGHLSDPSLLDSVDEDTYLDLNDSGRGSPTETYDFPVDRRPASPTSDPISTMSPFGKKMARRRDSSRGSSVGTASPCGPLSSPTNCPQRRKRCNTEPTAEFVRTPSSGSSTWSRSRSNSRGNSLDNKLEEDGYLMMMPVYEEKLKRYQKGIPQSPIHGAGLNKTTKSNTLRRSATVSGEVSAMSPRMMQRSMTLRERTSANSSLPVNHSSNTLTYRRPRGNSEGIINPGDIPRATRTDRTKHHYGPALDPSLLKKLTHKLNKFASGQDNNAEQQQHQEPLPEVTTQNTQFAIDPDNLGALNNNVDQGEESSSSPSKHGLLNRSANSSRSADGSASLPNGYADNQSSERTHDCNANPHKFD